MVDVVTTEKRSEMMRGIKGSNTRPEMTIRKGLHALGFRYKLHDRNVPGKPDMVFPRYRAVIFVHGCFWHNHHCHLFKWPQTRKEFWENKINGNVARDSKVREMLHTAGWRILIVWECAIKGKTRLDSDKLPGKIATWLVSNRKLAEITGTGCET